MDIESIFFKALKPSLGCSELAAIAYAVASATQATARGSPERRAGRLFFPKSDEVEQIRVQVNRGVFKNAFSIYIPNAEGHKGVLMASALGVFCEPEAGLELFSDLTHEEVETAWHLIQQKKVGVEIVEAAHTDLYIHATVRIRIGTESIVGSSLVQDSHTNLSLLKRGEEVLYRSDPVGRENQTSTELEELKNSTFEILVGLVEDLPASVLDLMRKTIDLNKKAAQIGRLGPHGLGVGFYETHGEEFLDLRQHISSLAAGGSDVRMSGYPVEVMSSAGSGNQGIVATIPVVAYCEANQVAEERLLRAVALSHLVTAYITMHIGTLSALCGAAIKAGIGAACGVTYAMGGGASDVCRALKIMVASISGVICDGAKPGCALKVCSSSETAVRAASLAMRKVEVSDANGIVGDSAEETIRNLVHLNQSMKAVDDKVVQILQQKISS